MILLSGVQTQVVMVETGMEMLGGLAILIKTREVVLEGREESRPDDQLVKEMVKMAWSLSSRGGEIGEGWMEENGGSCEDKLR
jgi:hypothetical protein